MDLVQTLWDDFAEVAVCPVGFWAISQFEIFKLKWDVYMAINWFPRRGLIFILGGVWYNEGK